MYDMNFALLTILYYYFKRHETYDYLEDFIVALTKYYKNENIVGGIVNLFFTDEEKMKEQLNIRSNELKDVVCLFKKSTQLLDNMKTLEIIPENMKFIYGIEDLKYIENEDKLTELYNLGLRSISNSYQNDYEELSDKTIELIKKAIELGMVITINKTSLDSLEKVIDLINENKDNEPIVIFNEDNISDLKKLPNAPYYILVVQNKDEKTKEEKEISFIKRIKKIKEDEFLSENKIILCKTNRNFLPRKELPISNQDENNSIYLARRIADEFSIDFANEIMYQNADEIFEKVLQLEAKTQKKYIA